MSPAVAPAQAMADLSPRLQCTSTAVVGMAAIMGVGVAAGRGVTGLAAAMAAAVTLPSATMCDPISVLYAECLLRRACVRICRAGRSVWVH